MAASPRISAIITAYNSAAYLRDSIESVLKQSRPVDEILVVDDGSSDDTPNIAVAYANAGVKYIQQENQGPGAARNLGLRQTNGEIIAFLDADDIWLENKTRLQVDYLSNHPNVGVVSGPKIWWRIEEGNNRWIQQYGDIPESRVTDELLINNVIVNPSMALIRRSVLDKAGNYNPDLRWGEDWELWIRISNWTHFGFVDEPVIIYRAHSDSLTHQDPLKSVNCYLDISRNAIRTAKPAWLRPIFLAHAESKNYFLRADNALKKLQPRKQQIGYALAAFLFYPWDDPSLKFKTVVRTLVGDSFYQKLKHQLRK